MMNDLSNLVFKSCCEVDMATDVLRMCLERMSGEAPEVNGMRAAILLLEKALIGLEQCEGMAVRN